MVGLESDVVAATADNVVEKSLVQVISCVLEQLVARNDQLPFNPVNATIFHATSPPSVSIKSYLERILKYTNVSSGCLIASLIYIDRFVQQQPSFIISSLNIHRLLITSVMTAMKFLDDLYYNNSYYAKVGGVPCPEMNSLELQFLFRLNFHLHLRQEEYERYQCELALHIQRANGCACAPCVPSPCVRRVCNGSPVASAAAAAAAGAKAIMDCGAVSYLASNNSTPLTAPIPTPPVRIMSVSAPAMQPACIPASYPVPPPVMPVCQPTCQPMQMPWMVKQAVMVAPTTTHNPWHGA